MSDILRKRRQTSVSLPVYNTNTSHNRQDPQNQISKVYISRQSHSSSIKATLLCALFCFTTLGFVSYYYYHEGQLKNETTATSNNLMANNNNHNNHRQIFSSTTDDRNSIIKEYYNPIKSHNDNVKKSEKKTYNMRGNRRPRHDNIVKDSLPSSYNGQELHHQTISKTNEYQKNGLVDSSLFFVNKNKKEENTSGNNNSNTDMVVCPNGSKGILNDDYCDCEDGSDEPITSACSNILVQKKLFTCDDGTKSVFLSRVNDGVTDCLDGSDETNRF